MFTSLSHAVTIQYQATDLPDTVSGIDEWRYDYRVSDHHFAVDTGFVIYFDPLLYADLQDPAPVVNGDWDVLITQPEPLFFEEGLYDAFSLLNTLSLTDTFSVDFVWLGAGSPSTQPFEIYDETFAVSTSGLTTADTSAVPLSPSLFLFGSGVFTMLSQHRKSNTIRSNQQNPDQEN